MPIEPYLFFEGRAEEAIQFYQQALGAELEMLMRYRENPDKAQMPLPPGSDDQVMHASFKVGGQRVMASDGMCSGEAKFGGFALSLTARDLAHAKQLFEALAPGGKIDMPLEKTFWAESFGMLTDRFGVQWMVGTEH
jgi:PhnB protein